MALLHVSNNRGSALLNALITALVVAGTTAIILQNAQKSDAQSQAPRIKSEMMNMENRIRYAALLPSTFTCTGTGNGNTGTCRQGEAGCTRSCDLNGTNVAAIAALNSDPTRYSITSITVNGGNSLHAVVHYIPVGLPIRDIVVDALVPTDVMMGNSAVCPDATPLFRGFDANGLVECDPITYVNNVPNNVSSCGPGQFISNVNKTNLQITCANLPVVSCPANQVITYFAWQAASPGVGTFTSTCGPRVDPFVYYDFTPDLGFEAAPVNGLCGTDNAHTFLPTDTPNAPGAHLCSAGNSSNFVGNAAGWTWNCDGAAGGTTAACTAHPGSSGPPVCGYWANGLCRSSAPPNPGSECQTSAGVPYGTVTDNGTYWQWRCTNDMSGATCTGGGNCIVCQARNNATNPGCGGGPPPGGTPGECGPSDGSSFTAAPTAGLCTVGTATAVTGTGPWNWQCSGSGGGAPDNCTANLTGSSITGACGSANGGSFPTLTSTSPNLCASGTIAGFAGAGPWSWHCNGSGGGGNSGTCNANRAAAITMHRGCYVDLYTLDNTLDSDSCGGFGDLSPATCGFSPVPMNTGNIIFAIGDHLMTGPAGDHVWALTTPSDFTVNWGAPCTGHNATAAVNNPTHNSPVSANCHVDIHQISTGQDWSYDLHATPKNIIGTANPCQ